MKAPDPEAVKALTEYIAAGLKEVILPFRERLREHANELAERKHQATRHAEHLARLETRVTQIKARLDQLEKGKP